MSNVLFDIYGAEVGTTIGNSKGYIIKVKMKHGYMDPRFIEKDDKIDVVINGVEEVYSIFNVQQEQNNIILVLEKVPNIKAF